MRYELLTFHHRTGTNEERKHRIAIDVRAATLTPWQYHMSSYSEYVARSAIVHARDYLRVGRIQNNRTINTKRVRKLGGSL